MSKFKDYRYAAMLIFDNKTDGEEDVRLLHTSLYKEKPTQEDRRALFNELRTSEQNNLRELLIHPQTGLTVADREEEEDKVAFEWLDNEVLNNPKYEAIVRDGTES